MEPASPRSILHHHHPEGHSEDEASIVQVYPLIAKREGLMWWTGTPAPHEAAELQDAVVLPVVGQVVSRSRFKDLQSRAVSLFLASTFGILEDRQRLQARLHPFFPSLLRTNRGRRIVVRLLPCDPSYTLQSVPLHSVPEWPLATLGDSSGHFSGELRVPVSMLQALGYPLARHPEGHGISPIAPAATPLWIRFGARAQACSPEEGCVEDLESEAEGQAMLLEEEGVSVISDVDDTLRISVVGKLSHYFKSTFLKEFEAVHGMAELYQVWESTLQARFHYISGTPCQLWHPLSAFLANKGFPKGSFHLLSFRMREILGMEGPSRLQVKTAHIENLLQRFPQRKFICVGDTTEQDPEMMITMVMVMVIYVEQIYVELAKRYPEQVKAIFIRRVPEIRKQKQREVEAATDETVLRATVEERLGSSSSTAPHMRKRDRLAGLLAGAHHGQGATGSSITGLGLRERCRRARDDQHLGSSTTTRRKRDKVAKLLHHRRTESDTASSGETADGDDRRWAELGVAALEGKTLWRVFDDPGELLNLNMMQVVL